VFQFECSIKDIIKGAFRFNADHQAYAIPITINNQNIFTSATLNVQVTNINLN